MKKLLILTAMIFGACSLQTPYLPEGSISNLSDYNTALESHSFDESIYINLNTIEGLLSGMETDLDDVKKTLDEILKPNTSAVSGSSIKVSGQTAELYYLKKVDGDYRAIYQIGNTYAAFALKKVEAINKTKIFDFAEFAEYLEPEINGSMTAPQWKTFLTTEWEKYLKDEGLENSFSMPDDFNYETFLTDGIEKSLRDAGLIPDTVVEAYSLVQITGFGFGFESKQAFDDVWEGDYVLPYVWNSAYIPDVPMADLVTMVKDNLDSLIDGFLAESNDN